MDESARVDGRTARGQRTRSAVVDELLALQEEGDLEPTAQRVAARAGVALRTVFGHSCDLETLWARVLEAVLPVLRAARLREHASAALRRNRKVFAAAGDAEVRQVFATELAPLDETDQALALSAPHVVAGGQAWELLRCPRGYDVDGAADVLRGTVRRVVPASGHL